MDYGANGLQCHRIAVSPQRKKQSVSGLQARRDA